MKKTVISIISIILAFAVFAGCAFIWHTREMNALQTRMEEETARKELLAKRMADVQDKLDHANEENDSLLAKLADSLTEEVYVFDSGMIMDEIRNIGQLATMEYRYTNVGTMDSSIEADFIVPFTVPLTRKTAIITMDGVIKVGVDLDGIGLNCNESAKTITVSLPKAHLISNELDENSLQVYDESCGLFSKITLADSSALRSEIKQKAAANAEANGVYQQAEENAADLIRCILESVPGLKETYTISFK